MVRAQIVQPIQIDPHFTPGFYAQIWGVSESTVLRWFQDLPGVLKIAKPGKNGRRGRCEIRIPYSLAMQFHAERSK